MLYASVLLSVADTLIEEQEGLRLERGLVVHVAYRRVTHAMPAGMRAAHEGDVMAALERALMLDDAVEAVARGAIGHRGLQL